MKFVQFIACVVATLFSLNFTDGQPEVSRPTQQTCNDLVAIRIAEPPPGCNCKSPTSWIIAKTTVMQHPYPEGFDNDNLNTCSVLTYGPDCAGIHFLRVPYDDRQGYETHTYADHKKNKKLLHFVEKFESKDPKFEIYEGRVQTMDYIVDRIEPTVLEEKSMDTTGHEQGEVIADENRLKMSEETVPDTKHVPVEYVVKKPREEVEYVPIPDFVKNDAEKMFAIVDIADDGRYLIMQTCDKQHAWVAISWQFPKTDPPQVIFDRSIAKIDEKLRKLGIDISTMVNVPLDTFTFKMYDHVFPFSDETATAGGASTSKMPVGGEGSSKGVTIGEGSGTAPHTSGEASTSKVTVGGKSSSKGITIRESSTTVATAPGTSDGASASKMQVDEEGSSKGVTIGETTGEGSGTSATDAGGSSSKMLVDEK